MYHLLLILNAINFIGHLSKKQVYYPYKYNTDRHFSGSIIMGIGSMIFIVPHFIAEPHSANSLSNNSDNICRGVPVQTQDMGLGRLSPGLSSPALAPHNQLRGENCIKGN